MDIESLCKRVYWSEVDGRRAVELWRASGQSLGVFCRASGVRRTRIAYWVSRVSPATALTLATVTVAAPLAARASNRAIAIELRSGRVVRVEGDFDDALLERVIVVAERAC